MKIAVTGKGGVGKTTVAAHLARCWRDLGHRVVAVDADPDANLAGTLGYHGSDITPLVQLKTLINERVGGGAAGGWGGFLKMNPRVDDIPGEIGVEHDGIRILVMGTIDRGRRGCACPENILLREVLNHLFLRQNEDVVVDMEAGIEHLGRATVEGVDAMLIVVEPGWASIETARRAASLGRDLGLERIAVVANKVASAEDESFVCESVDRVAGAMRETGRDQGSGAAALPVVGMLPLDRSLERAARDGTWTREGPFYRAMVELTSRLPIGERQTMNGRR